MNQQFFDEFNAYSIRDLQLILETQKELYSSEELFHIREILNQKQNLQNQQKKLSGDWNFCIILFLIYAAGRIAAEFAEFRPLKLLWLLFALCVFWNHYRIGNKTVSTETFYPMLSILHPVLGLIFSIWWCLMKIPQLAKKCAVAAGVSLLLQAFLASGGFQI